MKAKTLLIIFPVLIGTLFVSCKKKGCTDEIATNYNEKAKKDDGTCLYTPFITVIGASDTTILVGSTYNDPGATAANFDGASVAVTTTNNVNAAEVGVYEINYSATNNNGTSNATRTVRVVITQDSYIGSWSTSGDCNGQTGMALNGSPSIQAGANENQILITDFFNGLTGAYGTAVVTVNEEQMSVIDGQDAAPGGLGDIIYSGFGSMNSDGQTFTITFTYQNTTPITGTSGTCTATFAK